MRSIAVLGTGFRPAGHDIAPPEIRRVARPPFKPVLVEARLSVFPGTPFERGITSLGYVDAGIKAQAAGHAALFLNTFGDYGLAELRSALHIPVVGAGEATLRIAAGLGRRFAIVTIWPSSLNFIYHERLAATRMEDRCAGIANVMDEPEMAGLAGGESAVDHMRSGSAAMIDRIVSAAQRALADRDVDTIVLGCTCMSPVARDIAARLPVPVVDAMTTGYGATELLLSLSLTQSGRAYPRVAPARLALVDDLISGGAAPPQEAECAVCVVAEQEEVAAG